MASELPFPDRLLVGETARLLEARQALATAEATLAALTPATGAQRTESDGTTDGEAVAA
jgi:hypothetical protein